MFCGARTVKTVPYSAFYNVRQYLWCTPTRRGAQCVPAALKGNCSFLGRAYLSNILIQHILQSLLGQETDAAGGFLAVFQYDQAGNVDAVPLCLNTQDTDELVQIISSLEPSFGGINLEDIAAPRCFEVEKRLQEKMNIPVFHDDQHGTAIVVCAALVNALKLAEKQNPTIVINGAGSAGVAIATLILKIGLGNVILVDKQGILTADMDLTSGQRGLIDKLNKEGKTGSLKDALVGADVFIGVSAGHIVSKEMIASMNEKAIVFPMANPVPEIEPEDAKEAGAYIVGTGRSDHPNQINNVLAFPGIFKGALKAGATCINDAMKEAAVYAISSMITEDMLDSEHIIVSALDPRVADIVAQAVADAAKESGVVRE